MPPGRGSSSAFRPFHWIILSGSVKNSNTVAGAAAIRTSRSTMLRSSTCTAFPPFLELGRQRQALQAVCPEALHELAQPAQALRPRPVETPGSFPTLHDEPGLLQHRQVLGDRRSRDLELGRDLSGGQLCIPDELEDAPATRARVAGARVARLATTEAGAAPHLVPICYALEGDVLYSAVDEKPKRSKRLKRLANIRAHPGATVLVDHYEEDWTRLWWVRLRGEARVLEEGPERDRALGLLAGKYDQYRAEPPTGPVIALDVAEWRGWSAAPDTSSVEGGPG